MVQIKGFFIRFSDSRARIPSENGRREEEIYPVQKMDPRGVITKTKGHFLFSSSVSFAFDAYGKALGAYLVKARFEGGIILDGFQKILHVPCVIGDVVGHQSSPRSNPIDKDFQKSAVILLVCIDEDKVEFAQDLRDFIESIGGSFSTSFC